MIPGSSNGSMSKELFRNNFLNLELVEWRREFSLFMEGGNMQRYARQVEKHMRVLYRSLSEKDRRRYAAVEAEKLGYGGLAYVSELFGCDPDTIRKGKADVDALPSDEADGRIRKKGGRKTASEAEPEVVETLRERIEVHTAGSAVQPGELWTNRSLRQLSEDLTIDGFSLSPNTIDRLLREELGLGRRQAVKEVSLGDHPCRNDQFERIATLKGHFLKQGWPVISIDTKKKEILGDFFRPRYGRTDGLVRVFDHDFPGYGSGKVIPYGVYDLTANEGFMLLATGSDTGELACDAIRRWWYRLGYCRYEGVPYLLALADSGGSNGYRVPLFRERLCQLACRIGVSIRVAHLPPYCSKYNPIDHRLFCHLSRSLRGIVCHSIDIIRDAFKATTTSTGLHVVVEVARRVYQKGIKAATAFLKHETTQRDLELPQFNYVAPAE